MAATIKHSLISIVLGIAATVLTWTWLASGQSARTQTRLDDHERRLVKVEQIPTDLAEIKALLKAMQAEQRLLHEKPELGR